MGFWKRFRGGEPGKERESAASEPAPKARFSFPLGKNVISDPDIHAFEDLSKQFMLPAGYVFRHGPRGVPMITRKSDLAQFNFVIAGGKLTFEVPYPPGSEHQGTRKFEVAKNS